MMEKRTHAIILLLGFAIIGVHSFDKSPDALVDRSFGDEQYEISGEPDYQEVQRTKRSPGAPSNSSKRLSNLKKILNRQGAHTEVSHPEDVAQTERMRLMQQFNDIIAVLEHQHNISHADATARAIEEHADLADQIIEAYQAAYGI